MMNNSESDYPPQNVDARDLYRQYRHPNQLDGFETAAADLGKGGQKRNHTANYSSSPDFYASQQQRGVSK